MKRRKFIKNSAISFLGLPVALNGMNISPIRQSALLDALNPESDRVLVLIQMIGGNDGLNMLVPLDQYDNLYNARQNVILPQSSLENTGFNLAFHPSMMDMRSMFDDAKLKIVQNVGYPDQNRSHFRSTDIWTSASPADEDWPTGWLGRQLTDDHPTFPNDYPSEDFPDPLAIAIGSRVSMTCQGAVGNFSLAMTNPFGLGQLAAGGDDFIPDGWYGDQLEYVRLTVEQTNAYSERITEVANLGKNTTAYPNTNLANQLKIIALLLAGGSQTKVFVANIGGFDTHANQVDPTNTNVGEHTELLGTMSEAIAAFQRDLDGLGLSERVMGLTFSEFGRRIKSNDSDGTDHGSAAPLFLFGSCVKPGVLGNNPEIPEEVGTQDGVAMQFDFRDVYGSVLQDWFEVPAEKVQELIHEEYNYLPLIDPCLDFTDTAEVLEEELDMLLYPNPATDYLRVFFESEQERVQLVLFNAEGKVVQTIMDKNLPAGPHEVPIQVNHLTSGNYFVRLVCNGTRQKSKVFTKI